MYREFILNITKALESKLQSEYTKLEDNDTEDNIYRKGLIFGYYDILDIIIRESGFYNISIDELGIKNLQIEDYLVKKNLK
jgi:hypothetical protein